LLPDFLGHVLKDTLHSGHISSEVEGSNVGLLNWDRSHARIHLLILGFHPIGCTLVVISQGIKVLTPDLRDPIAVLEHPLGQRPVLSAVEITDTE